MMGKWRSRAARALVIGMVALLAGCAKGGAPEPGEMKGSLAQPGMPAESSDSRSAGAPQPESAKGTPGNPGAGETNGFEPDGPGAGAGGDSPPAPGRSVTMGLITAMRLVDGHSGWVGGEGWIARTDDGGTSWSIQHVGEKSQVVKQLFALNGKQAWAVLGEEGNPEGGLLLATSDGGKHWQPVGQMPNHAFLHFVSAEEGFAANARTTDGGRTWVRLPVPDGIVGDAYFHDGKNGWAVTNGDRRFFVKRTTDGGKSWTTVMARDTEAQVTNAVIRSAGQDDAWVLLSGGSGMNQTGYSLFHTGDGGAHWVAVLHHNTAGAGPGPGFSAQDPEGPSLGAAPGPLDVVSPQVAYVGGYCGPCEAANSVGWTKDGGKTFTKSAAAFPGYAGAHLMMADDKYGWWICTDRENPSVLFTTNDGGVTWQKTYTFAPPEAAN